MPAKAETQAILTCSVPAMTILLLNREQVKVDAGVYGISWNDDIDLSCEELYQNGK